MADSPIAALRHQYLGGNTDPVPAVEAALAHADSNARHNVYLAQDAAWSLAEARRLEPSRVAAQPLWGVPVSLKDCFDLAGFKTTCGSVFYSDLHAPAEADSTVAAHLRAAGAVITGKTHLHQLAYGITGESADYGDCVQPRNAAHLTGGSSSGAAASVQEGSAMAAIGTDTGGSVRVPAALCGLAGYRSSLSINTDEVWRGGAHLAASFDTVGWLYRDLRDGPLLGHALFGLPFAAAPACGGVRIGTPAAAYFYDCEPAIFATLAQYQARFADRGASLDTFDAVALWHDAVEIMAPIQATEAAALHQGLFEHFEPVIADRLRWGASIPAAELATLRERHADFRARTASLFERFDFLLLPCAPMAALLARADHTQTRARLLRYTAPISLGGLPVVAQPGDVGGLQLVGPMGSDAELLALSAALAV
jgi:Asp-tRNA(Asn)/Glu-tRNA(Gln) amidotransferase A subunit family amidase